MGSWISSRSSGEPTSASACSDARADPWAAGWPPQGALLDGASPLQIQAIPAPPTVKLAGDIDEETYPGLTGVLAAVARTGQPRIRVDLADVEYCDLAGLRAIITVAGGRTDGQGRGEQGTVEQGTVEQTTVEQGTVEQVTLVHVPDFLRAVLRVLGWDTTRGLIVEDETW